MKKNPSQPAPATSRFSGGRLLFILILVALLGFFVWQRMRTGKTVPQDQTLEAARSSETTVAAARPLAPVEAPQTTAPPGDGSELIPQPMQLNKKVLLAKPWNSAEDALTRLEPPEGQEGGVVGPHSVTYLNGIVYVLDSVSQRLIGYDKNGRMVSSVSLPKTRLACDLVADPADGSLFVIDQRESNVYKVKERNVTMLCSLPSMVKEFSIGEKFGFDATSRTLYINSPERGGDVPLVIDGQVVEPDNRITQRLSPVAGDYEEADPHNVILNFRNGEDLKIRFETPVQCVEQVTMDGKGHVWFLYTLEGDYRVYRLARVEPGRRTAAVAHLGELWQSYSFVRSLTPTENGVIIVEGDHETGRILSFEHDGGAL